MACVRSLRRSRRVLLTSAFGFCLLISCIFLLPLAKHDQTKISFKERP